MAYEPDLCNRTVYGYHRSPPHQAAAWGYYKLPSCFGGAWSDHGTTSSEPRLFQHHAYRDEQSSGKSPELQAKRAMSQVSVKLCHQICSPHVCLTTTKYISVLIDSSCHFFSFSEKNAVFYHWLEALGDLILGPTCTCTSLFPKVATWSAYSFDFRRFMHLRT